MNPFDLNRTMLATGQELSPGQLGEQSWTNSFNDCMLTLSTVDCTDLVAQCVSASMGELFRRTQRSSTECSLFHQSEENGHEN